MKRVFKKGSANLVHTTVWLNDHDWEILGALAEKKNKSRSAYIEDIMLGVVSSGDVVEKMKSDKVYGVGRARPLAFSRDGLSRIKAYTQKAGVSFSDVIRKKIKKTRQNY